MASVMNRGWSAVLVPTALAASLVVIAQSVATHASAYTNAPHELSQLLETMRDATAETEAYEQDVTSVSNTEDKVRLDLLLREIQKTNVSLSSDLVLLLDDDQQQEEHSQTLVGLPHIRNRMFLPTMKVSARLFWLEHRANLHSRLRRLDTLKIRFLVMYMGAVASSAHAAASASAAAAAATATALMHHHHPHYHSQQQPITPPSTPKKDDRMRLMQSLAVAAATAGEIPRLRNSRSRSRPAGHRTHAKRPSLAAEPHLRTPPRSAASTPSTDLEDRYPSPTRSQCSVVSLGGDPKTDGWSGVVAELQKSPKMEARRESIETAMRS